MSRRVTSPVQSNPPVVTPSTTQLFPVQVALMERVSVRMFEVNNDCPPTSKSEMGTQG